MTVPLAGCFEKVKRAGEHLKVLDKSIRSVLDLNPYTAQMKVYREHVEKHLLSRNELADIGPPSERVHEVAEGLFEFDVKLVDEFGLIIRGQPLLAERRLRWSVLVGEIVYQARSTLDHVAFELTVANGNEPPVEPVPRGSRWRKIAFPIVLKPADWDAEAKKTLWGLSTDHRAKIEALQPYSTHRQNPKDSPLHFLNELCNRDKHRALNVMLDRPWFEGLADRPILEWSDEEGPLPPPQLRVLEHHPFGGSEDSTEVARIEVLSPMRADILYAYMKVNLTMGFNVVLDEGPLPYPAPAVGTLEPILATVADILAVFA